MACLLLEQNLNSSPYYSQFTVNWPRLCFEAWYSTLPWMSSHCVCLYTPHSEASPQPWLCLRPPSSFLFASILKRAPPSCALRCPASRDSFACFHWEKFPFSLNPQYDAVHGIMAFVISPRGGTIWRGKPVQLLGAWTLEPNHLDSDPGSDTS